MKKLFICLLPVFLFAMPADSEQTKTPVIDIVDGDTIIINTTSGAATVHIAGYEAPEPGQPFFVEAKELLTKLINAKPVKVKYLKSYKDTADITPSSYKNIPIVMVSKGLGWVAEPVDQTLKQMETKARMKKVGVWSKNNPESPWAYRARHQGRKDIGIRIGPGPKPAELKIFGDSAADIKKDPDGTAIGKAKGGGFVFSNQGVDSTYHRPSDSSPGSYGGRSYSSTIKNDCEAKWGNDYRMIKYCVDKQQAAKRYIDNHANDREVLRMCEGKWGNDYRMVKYCYEKQRAAKRSLGY